MANITSLMPLPKQQFFGNGGLPLVGGKVYTYAAGTNNLKPTFTDAAGTIQQQNPIPLNARGEPDNPVYWSGAYKVEVRDALNNVVYTADNYNTDPSGLWQLLTGAGSTFMKFVRAAAGSVTRTVFDKLNEHVSVMDFGAVGDGVTDDTAAFTKAGAYANSIGADVRVPPPSVSYLLNSDPISDDNVNFQASPEWFTGNGRLPFHKFTAISEGVDPRIFSIKGMHLARTSANESRRKWALVGWVWYNKSPAAGSAGYTSDAVGVDGRGVCDAFNGRVWGLLGLAHMTSKAFNAADPGVSQAYACELDVNNDSGHDVQGFDSGPITRGLAIVSGSNNRPGEALYTLATNRPADGSAKDNRWWAGWRVYRDSVHPAGYIIHVDDENQATFARIPIKSAGIRWTSYEAINFAEYQDRTSKRRIMWSQTPGYGYDWINGTGQRIFSSQDDGVEMKMPLRRATLVEPTPATIDATKADIRVLTAGAAAITNITGGKDGQRLTLLNASNGNITITAAANMRLVNGTCVLPNTRALELVFADPTWFEVSRPAGT